MMRHTGFRRKRTPPPVKTIFLITMILFVVMTTVSIFIIDKGIKPTLMDIARQKLDEYATRGINSAVQFAATYNYDEVLNITKDNEGHVSTYNWNPAVVNEINRVATDRVEEFFLNVNRGEPLEFENPREDPPSYGDGAEDRAEQDPTLVEIPLGQITGNTILANLGPKIPVNFEVVGNVRTNIVRDEEKLGINSGWVSLYLHVEADVQIVIPFLTEVETVFTEIYIDGGALFGPIPDYYGGENAGPDIAVPEEDLKD